MPLLRSPAPPSSVLQPLASRRPRAVVRHQRESSDCTRAEASATLVCSSRHPAASQARAVALWPPDKRRHTRAQRVAFHIHYAEAIDLAFVDRADIKQYIGLPSTIARYQILRSCVHELGECMCVCVLCVFVSVCGWGYCVHTLCVRVCLSMACVPACIVRVCAARSCLCVIQSHTRMLCA